MANTIQSGEGLAISYLRFSSRRQKTNDSYRRQSEATEKYCKNNGLKLVDRLEDLGISAWTGKNLNDEAALGDFLNKVNSGKIPRGTTFICENLDRITRAGIFDALNIFSNILKAGIDIVTTMDNKRYSYESVKNNVGELIVSITYLTQGNIESEKKSERVKESWVKRRNNVRNGTFAKFPCPSWLTHNGKEYRFKHGAKEIVEKIFELYTSGMGAASVVNELNKQSIKSFTKTEEWNLVFIHEILQNPAVIGTYALIEPPVTGYYPAAISEDLYYKALGQRQTNNNFRGHTGKKEINIFNGLCECPKCKASMVKYSCKGKGRLKDKVYHLLACSKAKIKKCEYNMMDFDKFEDSFSFLFHSEHFAPFIESKTENKIEDRTPEIQGRLAELQKTIARVSDAIVKTDSDELVTRLGLLQTEKVALNKELEAELIRVKTTSNTSKAYLTLLVGIKKHIKDPDFRLSLRAFMRKTISKIICHADKYEIHFIGNPNTITVNLLQDGNYSISIDGETNYWRGKNGTIYNCDGTKTIFENDKPIATKKDNR